MNHDETIKVAYGIGCIATMKQAGVDPVAFCKQASVSGDDNLVKMAEAVASVYNHNASNPAYAEKVAAVAFAQPQAEKTAFNPVQALQHGYKAQRGGGMYSPQILDAIMGSPGLPPSALGMGNRMMGRAGATAAMAADNPLAAAGIGAAGLGAAGAGAYGANEAMQEDPWYQQAAEAAGLGGMLG